MPDYGKILTYRSPGGFGIRLDGGMGYGGAVITPFYDSLLVKVTAQRADLRRWRCSAWTARCAEFRIRGVKTNIPFLENVIHQRNFRTGQATTTLIDTVAGTVQVQAAPRPRDEAAELSRQRHRQRQSARQRLQAGEAARPPRRRPLTTTSRRRRRARGSCCWSSGRKNSPSGRGNKSGCSSPTPPSATRINRCWPRACALTTCWRWRTRWRGARRACSAWRCGAARRSTPRCASCTRTRGIGCAQLREQIPNICFQMLFRGSNAVGYSNYPDNVVAGFVKHAAASGIDIFRIFDSLNYTPNLKVAMEAVQETHAVCEAAICYTGDILDPKRAQVFAEILRQAGEGTGKNGRALPGDQGHGRPLPSATRRTRWSRRCKRGDRHSDPFSHARHQRRERRLRSAGAAKPAWTWSTSRSPR